MSHVLRTPHLTALLCAALMMTTCRKKTDDPSAAVVRSAPSPEPSPTPGETPWLHGPVDARFALVAKHLRGFDVAMVEVGYRYTELYWAGRDRNWDYAAYQLGKIETAVANGIERRPQRAASARMLDGAVAQVRTALEGRDHVAFDAALAALTATCNACHHAERVPFITVGPPTTRLSPVQPLPPAEQDPGATP